MEALKSWGYTRNGKLVNFAMGSRVRLKMMTTTSAHKNFCRVRILSEDNYQELIKMIETLADDLKGWPIIEKEPVKVLPKSTHSLIARIVSHIKAKPNPIL
jgi:hypothetical protein